MKKIKTYSSGLRLIVDTLKSYPSVLASICVNAGSCDDPSGKEGISHFVEHMMFKGTKKRTCEEIAVEFEEYGADVNALTSYYLTLYYCKTITEDISDVFEILSDIVLFSAFDEELIEKEKQVILEEIAMQKDKPYHSICEFINDYIYDGLKAKNSVIGNKKSVKHISREDIISYVKERYSPKNMVISFAGNITLQQAEKLVEKNFPKEFLVGNDLPEVLETKGMKYNFRKKELVKDKDIEQAHVMISFPSDNYFSKRIEDITLLTAILGDGMSSRLFQEVRENLGLVYHINCDQNSFVDAGDVTIYFATNLQNVKTAIDAIKVQIDKIKTELVPEKELNKAKKLLINSIIMSKESLISIAYKNAKDLILYRKALNDKQIINRLKNVTSETIKEIACEIFDYEKMVVATLAKDATKQIKIK